MSATRLSEQVSAKIPPESFVQQYAHFRQPTKIRLVYIVMCYRIRVEHKTVLLSYLTHNQLFTIGRFETDFNFQLMPRSDVADVWIAIEHVWTCCFQFICNSCICEVHNVHSDSLAFHKWSSECNSAFWYYRNIARSRHYNVRWWWTLLRRCEQ